MVVDGNNAFIRHYIVNPSISTNGQPIGGLVGFLRGLQKLSRMIRPDGIVVVWDGAGGSRKRKSMVKTYKEGRKPVRLNRNIRNLDENEEAANAMWQQLRVVEYLNKTPVIQFVYPEVEADDVIAYACNMPGFSEWQKVIVSSDKDFIQCCDSSTILYRPVQDEILNEKEIVEQFSIHPTNFALARAIAGDKSDNLPGVSGVGLSTIAKRLPMLKEEDSFLLSDLVTYCQEKSKEGSKVKFYDLILENMELIEINYKVMQLYSPSISVQTSESIDSTFKMYEPEFRQTEVIKMLFADGFPQVNLDEVYSVFKKIVREHKENY
jgi:5'-3' exonuclease